MSKTYKLKITSAVAIAGHIAKPGDIVDLAGAEARDLLARGKAELATEDEVSPPVDPTPAPVPAPKGKGKAKPADEDEDA